VEIKMKLGYLQLNPYVLLAFLTFSILIYKGISLIFFNSTVTSRDKRLIFLSTKSKILKQFDENAIEQEFINAGLKISFKKYYKNYKKFRYLILLISVILLIVKASTTSISTTLIFFIIMLYIISGTKVKIGKHWTPFGYVIKKLDNDFKKKQDVELSSIIIQLQNIAVSQKDEPTTLTYMLSRVVRFANHTKIAFIKMISHLDQGKEEEAREAFINEVDTRLGRDLAYILIELDKIDPIDVVNQLKLLEDRVRSENITNKNSKEEFYSDLMYIIPTILCFVILMNFLNIILNTIMNFAI